MECERIREHSGRPGLSPELWEAPAAAAVHWAGHKPRASGRRRLAHCQGLLSALCQQEEEDEEEEEMMKISPVLLQHITLIPQKTSHSQ